MKAKIILLLLLSITIYSNCNDNNVSIESLILDTMIKNPSVKANDIFKAWHLVFKKEYSLGSEEGNSKYKVFEMNLNKVKSHNADSSQSYKLGLNQFSDLTSKEFKDKHLMKESVLLDNNKFNLGSVNIDSYYELETMYTKDNGPAAWNPIDYTKYCGKVWDQQYCGCCYAFSAVNAIECNYNISKGQLLQLSRQQIVDCNELTGGCNGGNPPNVAIYASSLGLMSDKDYPFIGTKQQCQYRAPASRIVKGIELLSGSDLSEFRNSNAVYNMLSKGALSVLIDANANGIMQYKSGVITLTGCKGGNHAVMIIGYGVDTISGKRYWLIKNSWNTWWGDNGYMKVEVIDDAQNSCFLYSQPFRPIVD